MKYGSDKVSFLLIDGYSVLGVTTELRDEIEALTEEDHALGDAWVKSRYLGLKRASLEQSGFYDDAADGVHSALKDIPGVNRIVNYGVEGNLIGKAVVVWSGALQVNYQRIASRGALHRANARYELSGEVEEGVILHPLTAETEDGDTKSSPVENSGQTTNGAVIYLQATDVNFVGTLDAVQVQVEHSDDGESWDTLGDLMTFKYHPITRRIEIPGTIKKYLAVSWQLVIIETPAPSVTFMVAAVRK